MARMARFCRPDWAGTQWLVSVARMPDIVRGLPDGAALSSLAGGFALWGSVSEARSTRAASSRDLVLLALAAGPGAAVLIVLAPLLRSLGHAGPEIVLAAATVLFPLRTERL